jgi:hypothetical protein
MEGNMLTILSPGELILEYMKSVSSGRLHELEVEAEKQVIQFLQARHDEREVPAASLVPVANLSEASR